MRQGLSRSCRLAARSTSAPAALLVGTAAPFCGYDRGESSLLLGTANSKCGVDRINMNQPLHSTDARRLRATQQQVEAAFFANLPSGGNDEGRCRCRVGQCSSGHRHPPERGGQAAHGKREDAAPRSSARLPSSSWRIRRVLRACCTQSVMSAQHVSSLPLPGSSAGRAPFQGSAPTAEVGGGELWRRDRRPGRR